MKVAELKRRLQVGVRLRLVHSLLGPCDKLRVVDGFDSVDVWFTGDGIKAGEVSHLRWPKASQLRATDSGFEVLEDGMTAAEYEWGVDVRVKDLGGDLTSLVGDTEKGRKWLAALFPIEPGPDGGLAAEHEVLGGLEADARAAGLTVSIPARVKRGVDALEAMLRRAGMRGEPDFFTENHGSLACVQPLTARAREWLGANVTGEQTWLGGGLMVEPGYLVDLAVGMHRAGLVPR